MIKCNRQHLSNLHHGQRQREGQRKTKTINKNKEIQRLIDCARTIIWVTFIEGWQLMSLPTSGLKVCAITRKSFRVLLKCCLEIWSASHFQIHRLGAFFLDSLPKTCCDFSCLSASTSGSIFEGCLIFNGRQQDNQEINLHPCHRSLSDWYINKVPLIDRHLLPVRFLEPLINFLWGKHNLFADRVNKIWDGVHWGVLRLSGGWLWKRDEGDNFADSYNIVFQVPTKSNTIEIILQYCIPSSD